MNKTLMILLISVFFSACGNKETKKKIPCEFDTGKIIEKVVCKSDSTQSYALYLPSNYINNGSFPVLFCFDAHAGGVNAVEHFMQSAEKFGYVIAASNNSKNNEPNSDYIIEAFLKDVEYRINFDTTRKYTAGFSGGGRIATYTALKYNNIKGVASLSAGFSKIDYFPEIKFCFIGFFGNEDFNMYEIESSETALKSVNFNYYFEIFEGEHEWTPSENLEDALLFFELDAMRNNLKDKDEKFIKNVTSEFDSLIIINIENAYEQYLLNQKAVSFLKDLTDIDKYSEAIENIEKNQDFIAQQGKNEKIKNLENQLQMQYYMAFNEKDTIWWKKEISAFEKAIDTEKDADYKHLYKRTLNYLSMISYTFANKTVSSQDLLNAEKYLKIYELVDSDNTDMMYFYACFYSLKNNPVEAIFYLNLAIENGFTDYEKIRNEVMFENLKENTDFIEIIK